MNDSQRTMLFWLLLVAAPLVFLFIAAGSGGEPLLGILGALGCVGAALYIRAGRGKQ